MRGYANDTVNAIFKLEACSSERCETRRCDVNSPIRKCSFTTSCTLRSHALPSSPLYQIFLPKMSAPGLRARSGVPTIRSNDPISTPPTPLKSKHSTNTDEDGPTHLSLLDVLRMALGALLLSSTLSYFITGSSLVWNYPRPGWTRWPRVKAYWVCPSLPSSFPPPNLAAYSLLFSYDRKVPSTSPTPNSASTTAPPTPRSPSSSPSTAPSTTSPPVRTHTVPAGRTISSPAATRRVRS